MSSVCVAVIAFVQGIIVVRALGPSLYGILGVVMTFCVIIRAFLSFRTSEPLTRYIVEYKQKNKQSSLEKLFGTAILVDFSTSILAFAVIIATAPLAAKFISGGEESILIYWIYSATVLGTFLDATWYSVARDLKYFKLLAILPVFFSTLKLLSIILLWRIGLLNLLWLVTLFSAIRMGQLLVNSVLLIWKLQTMYKISVLNIGWKKCFTKRTDLSEFWTFMNITYLSSIVTTLVKNGDILILGYYRTDEEVGLYRLAKKLVSMIQSVGDSLSLVIYQDLNEMLSDKKLINIKKVFFKLLKWWIPSIMSFIIVGILIAEPLISNIYGDEYTMASTLFSILLVGIGVKVMLFWARPMILAMDDYVYNLYLQVIASGVCILFLLIVVPVHGAIGLSIVISIMWMSISGGLIIRTLSMFRANY